MSGETNIDLLLKNMTPVLNAGEYVFCSMPRLTGIDVDQIIASFKEAEGITVILKKETADKLKLEYTYIASWITLMVHSSLEATGLTAAFATTLANEGISCNVVAAFYHDHIFVDKKDGEKAMKALKELSARS